MPVLGPMNIKHGGQFQLTHPASIFIHKQKDLMKKGYSEVKSFEMVESEISAIIEKHREETRVLRGVALDSQAYSYLDRFQEIAEMESQLKMRKLERDMPKFLRAQRNYIKQFDDQIKRVNKTAAAQAGMTT